MYALQRIAAVLILTFIAGCVETEVSQQNRHRLVQPDLLVTEAHNNSIVPLRVGQVLEVRLRGNSTVSPPLRWNLAAAPPHVRLRNSDIVSESPNAVGAGATWIFRFDAITEGQGRLAFDGGGARQQVSYEVEVNNNVIID